MDHYHPHKDFHIIAAETKPLTPELVAWFCGLPDSTVDRMLDRKRIKFLDAKRQAGELLTFQWAVAVFNDKETRLNGHHSSVMLSQCPPAEFPVGCFVHLDYYELETPEVFPYVFRQFDAPQSARKAPDVARNYMAQHEELSGIPLAIGKLAVEAVAFHHNQVSHVAFITADDRYELFNQRSLHPFLLWVAKVIEEEDAKEFKNLGIMAAMYGSYAVNPDNADEFWRHVAKGGVTLADDAPVRRLSEWLMAAINNKLTFTTPQKYNAGAYCWRAWRDQRATIKEIKWQVGKQLIPCGEPIE